MSEKKSWCHNCGVPMYDCESDYCSDVCEEQVIDDRYVYTPHTPGAWIHAYCGQVVYADHPKDIDHECSLIVEEE